MVSMKYEMARSKRALSTRRRGACAVGFAGRELSDSRKKESACAQVSAEVLTRFRKNNIGSVQTKP